MHVCQIKCQRDIFVLRQVEISKPDLLPLILSEFSINVRSFISTLSTSIKSTGMDLLIGLNSSHCINSLVR